MRRPPGRIDGDVPDRAVASGSAVPVPAGWPQAIAAGLTPAGRDTKSPASGHCIVLVRGCRKRLRKLCAKRRGHGVQPTSLSPSRAGPGVRERPFTYRRQTLEKVDPRYA